MNDIRHTPIAQRDGEILELAWGRITWLVNRVLKNSMTMTFGLVTIKANCANAIHRHPNCDEILHLIRGRIEHSLGEKRFLMSAGDTISIPAGVWHNARALDGGEAEMVICFSSADRETEAAGETA